MYFGLMAHEQLMKRLRFLGEGSYSRVYEYGYKEVIKIPYSDGDRRLMTFRERKLMAQYIVDWTMELHAAIGSVVVPVRYHHGGCIVQRKFKGLTFSQVESPYRNACWKNIEDLCQAARDVVVPFGVDDYVIDNNTSNFTFDAVGRVVDWFDPIAPNDEELFR